MPSIDSGHLWHLALTVGDWEHLIEMLDARRLALISFIEGDVPANDVGGVGRFDGYDEAEADADAEWLQKTLNLMRINMPHRSILDLKEQPR